MTQMVPGLNDVLKVLLNEALDENFEMDEWEDDDEDMDSDGGDDYDDEDGDEPQPLTMEQIEQRSAISAFTPENSSTFFLELQ